MADSGAARGWLQRLVRLYGIVVRESHRTTVGIIYSGLNREAAYREQAKLKRRVRLGWHIFHERGRDDGWMWPERAGIKLRILSSAGGC